MNFSYLVSLVCPLAGLHNLKLIPELLGSVRRDEIVDVELLHLLALIGNSVLQVDCENLE